MTALLEHFTDADRDGLRESGDAVLASFAYDYGGPSSSTGEPLKVTREDGSYARYEYDEANRVRAERHHDAAGVLQELIEYGYDDAGNRTSRVARGGAGAVTSDKQSVLQPGYKLDQVTGTSAEDYDYDAGGRTTLINRGGSSRTLGYNGSDQLTSVSGQGTYPYDGEGRRVGSTVGAARGFVVAPNQAGVGEHAPGHRRERA